MSEDDLESTAPLRAPGENGAVARRLVEKVAFVTGASRGIGEAISRRFAAEGARVALAARNLGACERIAAQIRESGGDAIAIECDVTLGLSISNAVAEVSARWGRIDVLVNNAGLGGPTPLDDPDDSRWNSIIATNLTAVFRVTREAAPFLPQGGRIINLSSVVGRFGVAGPVRVLGLEARRHRPDADARAGARAAADHRQRAPAPAGSRRRWRGRGFAGSAG